MDLYLPDDYYALNGMGREHDAPAGLDDDMAWLGGEAQVAPFDDVRRAEACTEPDPSWRAI